MLASLRLCLASLSSGGRCPANLANPSIVSQETALPTGRGTRVRVVRHGDDRLTGIAEVDVVVSVTTASATRCLLERASLGAVAVDVLRNARIKASVSEKAPSWFHSVLVTVTAAPLGDSCAASITTELVAEVEAMPEADLHLAANTWGSLLVGQMPLVSEHALVTVPADEHVSAVQKTIRTQVTAIAQRIRTANP